MNVVLSLILNSLIFLSTTGVMLYHLVFSENSKKPEKYRIFRFYTTDSNVLAAFGALAVVIYDVIALKNGSGMELPLWAMLLKYVGTVAVTVTFMTVMCFLGPTFGYPGLFAKDGIYMHLLGPIFALVSFIFFENTGYIGFPMNLLGASTVLIYGIVYLCLVVVRKEENGGWPDFYGFNRGGHWPVSFSAMVIASVILSILLAAGHNAFV